MIDIQSESGSTPSQGHGQGQVTSTAHLSSAELGQWNTSTRLLATLLNDHMVVATPCVRGRSGLILHGIGAFSEPQSPALWVALSEAGQLRLVDHNIKANTAVFPEDFAPPAVTTTFASPDTRSGVDLAPASIFNHLRPVLNAPPVDDDRWDEICCELTNSAENGHYWNEWYRHRKTLSFKSSRLEWEQALYTGHPLHPMHRGFRTEDCMPKILPKDISSMMRHSISFISVPGDDVRVTGQFRQALAPLAQYYGIENVQPGRVILPCITMQIPIIQQYHPEMKVILKDAFQADTQSSLRTTTVPFYEYDLKFALSVTIGSAIRTISARTAAVLYELGTVLKDVLPDNLWLMGEVGTVAGRQKNFNHSKHISCVFRENFDNRSFANNETLVVTGALQEIPPGSDQCNAALIYGLRSNEEKLDWFSMYTEGIIDAFVGPMADYGLAFEAHAQNVLIRMDRTTGKINGWATRDLGSMRIHMPTFVKSGCDIFSFLPGNTIPTDSESETWAIIQFCLFQNHLNVFIYRLGIPRHAAWAMVRGKLEAFFEARKHLENIQRLREFLFAEEIPSKAFMVMKFAENQIKYEYTMVANALLEGMRDRVAHEVRSDKTSPLNLNGASNGAGKPNGINGHSNSQSNGHTNGHSNGHSIDVANGTKAGNGA